ncbi:MAG: diacylglycerol kinase family protein [Bacteroidetes bacterium]|nr:diacylglycerol kinase family protein [Bacteroidota bacterium]MBL0256926.1 diacylglycerol kinase family protein [Bacteroidota bacterium]
MGKSARKSFLGSFKPAIAGLAAAYRSQFNMRFHVAVTVLVLAASFYFQLAPLEWCVILFCIGSVIVAELLNTSLEVTVDIASPQIQEKAGLAKDIAAAAVLIAAIMSVIIGLIIFIPRILPLVNSWM